jgi:hypothetical protein
MLPTEYTRIFCSVFYEVFSVTRLHSDDDRVTGKFDKQTKTNIHAFSAIRTHGLSFQAIKAYTSEARRPQRVLWTLCVSQKQ